MVEFQANDTVRITFDAVNNQRMKVTLQYKDKATQKPVSWGACSRGGFRLADLRSKCSCGLSLAQ